MSVERCQWSLSCPQYIDYHDKEWGKPLFDEYKLFEFLILEGMQAGLSWLTILKRREVMRDAFFQFDPNILAQLSDKTLDHLLTNPKIIRNRNKVYSLRKNARAWLNLAENRNCVDYLWQFVEGQPTINRWHTPEEIPAQTKQSQAMSKQLKQDGFSFVGPTICYAFMQATGMVNDHILSCFRHPDYKRA
jgi:DNA-3-methyladenine glycosylase I